MPIKLKIDQENSTKVDDIIKINGYKTVIYSPEGFKTILNSSYHSKCFFTRLQSNNTFLHLSYLISPDPAKKIPKVAGSFLVGFEFTFNRN